VNTIAGAASFILMVILYAIIRNEYLLFNSNLCGFAGVIGGFTVAVKQLIPEQEIKIFFALSMRAKHLPGVTLLLGIAFFAFGLPSRHLPHMLFGIIGAWVYLRYYQRKGEVIGDLSNSFAFETFWPEPIQPLIFLIGRILSFPLRFVGIMPTPTAASSYSSPYSQNLPLPAPPVGPDAERRRALAQRAVDARMAHQTKLTASQVMTEDTPTNEISASAEIIPEPTPASLSNTSSRLAHPVGDKT